MTIHAEKGATLSAREIEMLSLYAEGLSRAEIAAKLHVSASTVKGHLWRIYQKVGARNGRHAIALTHDVRLRATSSDSEALPPLAAHDLVVEAFHRKGDPVNWGLRGVRITHRPTGEVAACAEHRSGLQNKVDAVVELTRLVAARGWTP